MSGPTELSSLGLGPDGASPDRAYGATLLRSHELLSDAEQPRRQFRSAARTDRLNVLGAATSGLCVAFLLFGRLAAFSGILGFFVVAYVSFLAVYTTLVSLTEEGPAVRDKVVTVLLYTAGCMMVIPLVFVITFTLYKGRLALVHLNFYTKDMSRTGPLDPLTSGGIEHALVGTLWMIGIALAITVPLGLTTAVYLTQVGGRLAKLVLTVVDAMTALPSIVAGLFIYASWILTLHHQKSGLAAALAISIMMLPIMTRASVVVLRLVPGNLREASAALGASQWRTVWNVVLPTARSGLSTAVILATARGIGETAPVLLTAGYTLAFNNNPTHGPMVSLPLAAFTFVSSGEPNLIARGFATAAFLLLVVLTLFVIARILGGHGPGHVTPRGARRLARGSARDLARFDAGARRRLIGTDESGLV